MKTCCITGHRIIPEDQEHDIDKMLFCEVTEAYEKGYLRFLCGFASGADMMFAKIVAWLIAKDSTVQLVAALPNRARLDTLRKKAETRDLISLCSEIYVASETYHSGVFMKRNRYMVEQSQLVIAVYDGREKGGTASTVRLAKKLGREIHIIPMPCIGLLEDENLMPSSSIHIPEQKAEKERSPS